MDINKAISLAFEYFQTGNLQKAEEICKEVLELQPNNADALHLLGLLYYQLKNYVYAIQFIRKALEFSPSDPDAYYDLGNALHEKGDLDEAITCYQKALHFDPNFIEAYNNLGFALQDKGQLDEAITCYQKAIELNPNYAEAYNNLGYAFYLKKEQLEEALTYYHKALQLNPTYPEVHNNLGLALQDKGQLDEAITCYQKAIRHYPNFAEAHWNMALALLLSGNFKDGWEKFEWRWRCISLPRNFSQPLWDSSDITGRTILLHAEQGFGDTIQFIRYVPLVAQCMEKVIVECQEELKSLLQNVEGADLVIARGEPLPEFDIHCPILSLPLVFKTTLENIPLKIPYIIVDPILVQRWKDRIHPDNSKLKIGIVWSVKHRDEKLHYRSCPLELFSPLTQFDDITFYSLQKGAAGEQAKNPPQGIKLIDYTEEIHDFSDTAAFIENLDLIISVDTAVVHLAGALGKSVWTLVPFAPDWRWMLTREDSPWYPTMRLFRQSSPGDWEPVIASIEKELSEFISNFD